MIQFDERPEDAAALQYETLFSAQTVQARADAIARQAAVDSLAREAKENEAREREARAQSKTRIDAAMQTAIAGLQSLAPQYAERRRIVAERLAPVLAELTAQDAALKRQLDAILLPALEIGRAGGFSEPQTAQRLRELAGVDGHSVIGNVGDSDSARLAATVVAAIASGALGVGWLKAGPRTTTFGV